MENKENCESRLQTLLIKDWFSEQPGNVITKIVCVINDKTLFHYIFIGNKPFWNMAGTKGEGVLQFG